jgi:phenylpropionate dioxygenase-like ring-hydroxylating dioxygenase large terminal subunit
MNDATPTPPKTVSGTDGRAYGRTPGRPDDTLTQVGPGTPMGEYLRRFWHPVAIAQDVMAEPRKVRILGEDLIIFRDGKGRIGLLYPHCMHRGTSLFYGRVEAEGIRCCYHGWLFSVQGHCLEQPCEPDGGLRKDLARQPWYPTQEKYGLVFAYLGPADKQPQMPRFSHMESLSEGESYEVDNSGFGGYADSNAPSVVPCNWLQDFENVMDPYHVQVLHSTFSGVQFSDKFALMPKVEWHYTDHGVIYQADRTLDDGRQLTRVNSVFLPNISAVPRVDAREGQAPGLGWYVPVDDDSHTTFWVSKVTADTRGKLYRGLAMHNGKYWSELSEKEHQQYPGDAEAQTSQGSRPRHGEWHMAQSDRGVAMVQRMLKKEIQKVQNGETPINATFEEDAPVIEVKSGNYYR